MHEKLANLSEKPKLLIIRFSSFGDIVHAMGTPSVFLKAFPNAQVDWLVRADLASLLKSHPSITTIHSFDRKQGLVGLVQFVWMLSSLGYTHIYDAHNNVRSNITRLLFFVFSIVRFKLPPKVIVRSKERLKRALLFKFRVNLLPKPFRGIASFQKPLEKWVGLSKISTPQFFIDPAAKAKVDSLKLPKEFISLVPSAAWEMKRWPIENWKKLIASMNAQNFIVLGGPEDSFCEELKLVAPDRVLNLAGKLSLQESSAVVERSQLVIANDTGLLHVSDQLGVKTLALIGPTAFGYPYHSNSEVAEIALWCKPCSKDGRGKCVNDLYKRCLVELSPEAVAAKAHSALKVPRDR